MSLIQLDNEDLSIFPDKSFDVVFSNFSLHLVNNPAKMINESSRVLNDKGVAAFSIIGRSQNSLFIDLVKKCLKKLENFDISLLNSINKYKLSEAEDLKELIFLIT